MNEAITVSQLVRYLKGVIEDNAYTHNVMVEGEISNFTNHRSGHWYFSLKDESAVISCTMFSSYNKSVSFEPKEGDLVIVRGNVSVYEARGTMQLVVQKMENNRLGELYLKFEALKKKLYEAGLFDEDHKKEIPQYPMRIGLITGDQTAARADVLTTLERRWPVAKIVDYTVNVQGKESAPQIIEALKKADQDENDVLLLVRGGGSIEDLWSFNDEALAKVIYQLKTPIVTGIGHEINETIADYVADLRAATPTAAAELVSPNIEDVYDTIDNSKVRLYNLMKQIFQNNVRDYKNLKNSRVFLNPERLYSEKQIHLHYLEQSLEKMMNDALYKNKTVLEESKNQLSIYVNKRIKEYQLLLVDYIHSMDRNITNITQETRNQLSKNIALLDAYSPLKILQRGYTITTKNQKTIRSIKEIKTNDTVTIQYIDGQADAKVVHTKENKNG